MIMALRLPASVAYVVARALGKIFNFCFTSRNNMDALLPHLLAFPPHPPPATPIPDSEYHRRIKNVVQALVDVPASKLVAGVPGGGDLLDIIDPKINTLPYLYVLLAHISCSASRQKIGTISEAFSPGALLWQKMVDFMNNFDPIQIRYGGNELRRLIELTAEKAWRLKTPAVAISPVRTAILRIDPTGSTLTSSHVRFVRLCLHSRSFKAALPVLDSNIYYLPAASDKIAEATANSLFPYPCSNHDSSSTFITPASGISAKLDYRDYLQYFLYGAMVYMGIKDWEPAIFFLEIVVTHPTTGNVSMIQVEAYKKWVLACLLFKGQTPGMPKTTSPQSAKMYHTLAKVYDSFADIFKDGIANDESSDKLSKEASHARRAFEEDFNLGLVRQVLLAYRKYSVLQLEETYAALTIADVSHRTSPDPNDYAGTGQYLIHLISTGQLNAAISQPSEDPATWILRFAGSSDEGPLAQSAEQQYEDIKKQAQKINVLNEHIKEADRKLGLSKEYIQEAKKVKKFKNGVGAGNDWAQESLYDHDEDVMGMGEE